VIIIIGLVTLIRLCSGRTSDLCTYVGVVKASDIILDVSWGEISIHDGFVTILRQKVLIEG
jgi:hypothetical protein